MGIRKNSNIMSLTTYFHDPFFDTSSVFPDFNRWFDAAYDARTSAPSNRELATSSDGGLVRPRWVSSSSRHGDVLIINIVAI
ncbi:MAG TPA: hypothetical protein VGO47_09105 [Chlamydiales bacterium]|nr:hypothetical protein [Chlamydiales bacterium]